MQVDGSGARVDDYYLFKIGCNASSIFLQRYSVDLASTVLLQCDT